VFGQLIHHTNVEDAVADTKRLVCYDCGVACDLTKMRDDRIVALRSLGADKRPAPRSLPVVATEAPQLDVAERGGGSPAEAELTPAPDGIDSAAATAAAAAAAAAAPDPDPRDRENARRERVRRAGFVGADTPYARYRLKFAKVGRAAFLGHLDLARLWGRTFRRAELELALSRGFSPKPRLAFGPALGLGVPSLGELMDVDLEHAPRNAAGVFVRPFAAPDAPRSAVPATEVARRLAAVCPEGLVIIDCEEIAIGAPGLGKLIDAIDLVFRPAPDGIAFDAARLSRLATAFLARDTAPVERGSFDAPPVQDHARAAAKPPRTIDVRALVPDVEVVTGPDAARLAAALGWPETDALLRARVRATAAGSARPVEVARALGIHPDRSLVARLGVATGDGVNFGN
jgi:hypothetical protein